MPKVPALNRKEQKFVANLRESLRRGSSDFSRLWLVHLTGVALQSLPTGIG